MPYLPLFSLLGFRHESGWPAIWRDCLGLIIVYNPVRTEEEDLVEWHTWFAKPAGLKDSQVRLSPYLECVVDTLTLFCFQVLILAHSPDRAPDKKPLRSPHPFVIALWYFYRRTYRLIAAFLLQPRLFLKYNAPLPRWDRRTLKSSMPTRRLLLPRLSLFWQGCALPSCCCYHSLTALDLDFDVPAHSSQVVVASAEKRDKEEASVLS